jgi:hypothetical protein
MLSPHAAGLVSIATLAIALAGCGDNDDASDDTSGSGADTSLSTPTPSPDDGCDYDFPNRVTPTPRETGALVTVCTTDGRQVLTLKNTSLKVLRVWAASDDPPTRLTVSAGVAKTPADLAALDTAPASCRTDVIECTLPAGATVTAQTTADRAVNVHFAQAPGRTAVAGLTRILTSWAVGKVSPRFALRQRVEACAENARNEIDRISESSVYLEDVTRQTLGAYSSCGSLIRDVLRETGDEAPKEESGIRQVLAEAKVLFGGSYDDEIVETVVRVFHPR